MEFVEKRTTWRKPLIKQSFTTVKMMEPCDRHGCNEVADKIVRLEKEVADSGDKVNTWYFCNDCFHHYGNFGTTNIDSVTKIERPKWEC